MTVAPASKLLPVMVSGKPELPTITLGGERFVIVGAASVASDDLTNTPGLRKYLYNLATESAAKILPLLKSLAANLLLELWIPRQLGARESAPGSSLNCNPFVVCVLELPEGSIMLPTDLRQGLGARGAESFSPCAETFITMGVSSNAQIASVTGRGNAMVFVRLNIFWSLIVLRGYSMFYL